jgi:hypothetical protein
MTISEEIIQNNINPTTNGSIHSISGHLALHKEVLHMVSSVPNYNLADISKQPDNDPNRSKVKPNNSKCKDVSNHETVSIESVDKRR